jgi:hypothetical protein
MASACYMSKPDGSEAVYLDEDPAYYDDGPAERRASSSPTLGGGRVWQDFGVHDVDREIRLRTDWMSEATLAALKAKYATTAQVWKWVDHKGHDYRVFFAELRPERIRGNAAYRVEMRLQVIQVIV